MPMTVTAPGVNWLEELTVESQPPDRLEFYQQERSSVDGKRRGTVLYSGSRALITYGQVVSPRVLTSTKRYKV